MNIDEMTTSSAVWAAGFVAGFFVLGLVVRKLVIRYLKRRHESGPTRIRDIVLEGVSIVVLSWSVIAGLIGALAALPTYEGVERWAGKVLTAAAIMSVTIAAARVTGGVVGQYASGHDRLPGATSIFTNIAKVLIYAVGLLVILQTLGVSVTPILTALGVGGLAVALALQDTLSNLFSGLHIIASGKLRPGDYVMLDSGEEGYVVDVNWRNTSLRNLRNNVIVVPNSHLASTVLTNFYQPVAEMSLLLEVGVSYSSDLGKTERVTIEVAREVMREVEGGIPDFEPFIRYHTFGDFSIGFTVILRVKEHTNQYLVKHEFVKRLHRRYQETGIEIPFPIRTVLPGDQWDQELAQAGAGSD